jgi:hypothetical protein
MKKALFYRVKIGLGPDDFVSISEDELKRTLNAQIKGTIVVLREGSVAGNSIISITPDYNRVLGLNRDYRLTGEDYDLLGDESIRDHRTALEEAKLSLKEGNNNIKKLN